MWGDVPATQRERVIRVDDVFDIPAARRVQSELEGVLPGDSVRLDCTRVREFHDFGIAVLAQALAERSQVHVALYGLRQHHLRLLRYLGFDTGVARDAGADVA
jgi:STAS domain